jgi:hypothetical protein
MDFRLKKFNWRLNNLLILNGYMKNNPASKSPKRQEQRPQDQKRRPLFLRGKTKAEAVRGMKKVIGLI